MSVKELVKHKTLYCYLNWYHLYHWYRKKQSTSSLWGQWGFRFELSLLFTSTRHWWRFCTSLSLFCWTGKDEGDLWGQENHIPLRASLNLWAKKGFTNLSEEHLGAMLAKNPGSLSPAQHRHVEAAGQQSPHHFYEWSRFQDLSPYDKGKYQRLFLPSLLSQLSNGVSVGERGNKTSFGRM